MTKTVKIGDRVIGGGNPILISDIGEMGARDPFLIRDVHNPSHFYLIATDLRIANGKGWDVAQYAGSRSLLIWESEDLIQWSKVRSVEIGVKEAGCVWAPEAIYDQKRESYLVFFASMVKLEGDENAKQRISYVLNGAMDVSTIDTKKIKIVDSKYSLSNLLTEICLKFKSMATEKNLEFRKNIEESLPETLYGDSIRLKQIISALLLNSIKYTKEGFVELNVNTVITYDVCRLVISVKDSGIGVNAEKLNKIFSQNDDTKIEDVDSKEMTLDTAKKVVNLIGGTITVRSEKNKGSEFTLIVDQKIASSNDKIDNIINEYKKTEDKIKILLVDDNEEERTLLTKKLGGISKLTIAKNGEEGLKRIRNKEKYDVLLIKESMEKLDAYQIIKKAKILEFVPDKIIVLADNKEEEEKLTINGYNAIFFDTSEQQFIKKLNNIIKK